MILAAFLFLAAQDAHAGPPDPQADEHEITVVGEQLDRWHGEMIVGADGRNSCKVRQSTSDAAIDRIGCDALIACMPRFQSHFAANGGRKLSQRARSRMTAAASNDFAACTKSERNTRVIALVRSRRETAQ